MPTAPKNYGVLTSLDQLRLMADKLLEAGRPVGFDIETGYTGPDRAKGSLDMMWAQQFACGFLDHQRPSLGTLRAVAHDFRPDLPGRESWVITKPVFETLPAPGWEPANGRRLAWWHGPQDRVPYPGQRR